MPLTALGRVKRAIQDVEECEATVRASSQLYQFSKSTLHEKIL